MILKFKNTLRQHFFYEVIMKEFNRLVNEEFKDVFAQTDVKPEIYWSDSRARLWNNEIDRAFDDNEIIGRTKLRRIFITELNKGKSLMSAHYCYREDYRDGENYFKLTELTINVDYDDLANVLVNNLENLELIHEMVLLDIRHEVGHLMDYVSWEKLTVKTFRELRKENEAAKDEYFKKYYDRDGAPKKEISERERSLHYYIDIPFEANADSLSGVDRNRGVEIDEIIELPDDADDFIELEVNVISNKRVKKEDGEKKAQKESGKYE